MSLSPIFVSHGSPMLALDAGTAGEAWRRLADELPRPRAILAISAHWSRPQPALTGVAQPATIHDFYGFPAPMYQLQYPAPGAPELAADLRQRLVDAGFDAGIDHEWGLDHGAWVPLRVMYPEADIPVVQLAIQHRLDPAHHYRVGQALAGLVDEDVLVFASGSLTHNLYERVPHPQTRSFQQWFAERLAANDVEALLDYRHRAPDAVLHHPTDEHLLPLFVALGAAGKGAKASQRYDALSSGGGLAMDLYRFEPVAA